VLSLVIHVTKPNFGFPLLLWMLLQRDSELGTVMAMQSSRSPSPGTPDRTQFVRVNLNNQSAQRRRSKWARRSDRTTVIHAPQSSKFFVTYQCQHADQRHGSWPNCSDYSILPTMFSAGTLGYSSFSRTEMKLLFRIQVGPLSVCVMTTVAIIQSEITDLHRRSRTFTLKPR